MRANIQTRLTNKQQAAIRAGVADEMRRQGQDNTRRIFKLLCAALYEEYGFGKVRCMRILRRINEVAAEHEHDEVYWTHIDRLMEQIGLEFSKEDYTKMDK